MSVIVFLFACVELAALIKLGQAIGSGSVLGIILLTAVLGLVIIRLSQRPAFSAMLMLFLKGSFSLKTVLMQQELILPLASVLLIIPGLLSDACGIMLLFWHLRIKQAHISKPNKEDIIDVDYHVEETSSQE